jgi:hypothetical protein
MLISTANASDFIVGESVVSWCTESANRVNKIMESTSDYFILYSNFANKCSVNDTKSCFNANMIVKIINNNISEQNLISDKADELCSSINSFPKIPKAKKLILSPGFKP